MPRNIFTISPSQPFAATLVEGILARLPETYADALVLVPNRRAVAALKTAWLNHTQGKASLLPRIEALADVDEDRLHFEHAVDEIDTEIPPAIDPLERSLILAQFVRQLWGETLSADHAFALAEDLGRLIDTFHTHEIPLTQLATLVDEKLATHWQITHAFLQAVLEEHWPSILAEKGKIDKSLRQRVLVQKRSKNWAKTPPDTPVIVAGSTGSIPFVAELISTISQLPNGYVVLPGLDTVAPDLVWQNVVYGHPQAHLKNLLQHCNTKRSDITLWVEAYQNTDQDLFSSTLMLPPEHLGLWQNFTAVQSLNALSIVEAETVEEEARAITLLLRQTLEAQDSGKTALLVTPDRDLAMRVRGLLKRYGVEIDDSAGTALINTPVGRYLLLTAALLEKPLAPTKFMAALSHDLVKGPVEWAGAEPFKTYVQKLDLHLRGAVKTVSFLDAPQQFVDLFEGAEPTTLQQCVQQHVHLAETLAGGAEMLWQGEAGVAAATLFSTLLETSAQSDFELNAVSYTGFLQLLLKKTNIHFVRATHPNIQILGQIEARFVEADVIILAGLNEGVWPAEAKADAWLSRPMRANAGLPPLESKISLAAHDFAQAIASPQVVLTYSVMREGAPVLASRFVERVRALETITGNASASTRGTHILAQTRLLDLPQQVRKTAPRPSPAPPVAARPQSLSVTRVAILFDDPYSIYASKILRLSPLKLLEAPFGAAELGTQIHQLLEHIPHAKTVMDVKHLIAQLEQSGVNPVTVRALMQMAENILAFEVERKAQGHILAAESKGQFTFQTLPPHVPLFTLTGIADRIDKLTDGTWAIFDFKSGKAASSITALNDMKYPQLPLLALLAEQGTFEGIESAGFVSQLAYISVMDRANPMHYMAFENVDTAKQSIKQILEAYLTYFAYPHKSYVCLPRGWRNSYEYDYAHLSRQQEWMGGQ